jgi:hypothetical protein
LSDCDQAQQKGEIMSNEPMVCVPKALPQDQWVSAAREASRINPLNHAPVERLMAVMPEFEPSPLSLAVLTMKYWGSSGVKLTVGFLDDPPADLRGRLLSHMNAWSKTANVTFMETSTDPQVRIARAPWAGIAGGYWPYVGTDILQIPPDQPTMMLEGFTMATKDSEFYRVVRHESGHTLGCPHEHMRSELVEKIDPEKAIAYFGETQGWSEAMVRRQVLTPIENSSLWGTAHADPDSIMCYQIPGVITKEGFPILGGMDISNLDYSFIAHVYPVPQPAPPGHLRISGNI